MCGIEKVRGSIKKKQSSYWSYNSEKQILLRLRYCCLSGRVSVRAKCIGGHIYTTVTTNRRVATYAQPQGDAGTGDAAYGMVPPMDDSQALNPQMQ